MIFFNLTETLVISGNCSKATYDNNKNEIKIPGNTNQYRKNQWCQWNIVATPEYMIELEFKDFHLPAIPCKHVYLNIFDGDAADSKQIGDRLCGSISPNKIISSGNKLHLQWRSDHSGTAWRFEIYVKAVGKLLREERTD